MKKWFGTVDHFFSLAAKSLAIRACLRALNIMSVIPNPPNSDDNYLKPQIINQIYKLQYAARTSYLSVHSKKKKNNRCQSQGFIEGRGGVGRGDGDGGGGWDGGGAAVVHGQSA